MSMTAPDLVRTLPGIIRGFTGAILLDLLVVWQLVAYPPSLIPPQNGFLTLFR